MLALRWATVATGVVVTAAHLPEAAGPWVATVFLLAYSAWRTVRPLPRPGVTEVTTVRLAIELAVGLVSVGVSGGWDSPYLLTLAVPMLLAGFSRGYAGGLVAAALACVGLGLGTIPFPSVRATPEAATQAVMVYIGTAVAAGYARRLFLEAEARREVFADRMSRLTEANTLLAELTQVTQTLPTSLDLGDTVAAAMGHFRELFEFDGAAILVLDPATRSWRAEAAAGHPLPATILRTEDLPSAARTAIARLVAVHDPALDPDAGRPGLWADSRSALYGPLVARDHVVALAALEHHEPRRFTEREAQILAGLADPLALAIDNALWFERLRTLGAEGERDRLARNLHDRIGQGLAYVGLELDRLSRLPDPAADLVRLRQEVGKLLGEVRETLRQLRTRVTETTGLASLADTYMPRFTERTGVQALFTDRSGGRRFSVPVEQELWRVLQEAMSNVERHSGATHVEVAWTVSGGTGRLEIRDNGHGFEPEKIDDLTPSGIMAMRERANAIGARLNLESRPGVGTELTVEVEVER